MVWANSFSIFQEESPLSKGVCALNYGWRDSEAQRVLAMLQEFGAGSADKGRAALMQSAPQVRVGLISIEEAPQKMGGFFLISLSSSPNESQEKTPAWTGASATRQGLL